MFNFFKINFVSKNCLNIFFKKIVQQIFPKIFFFNIKFFSLINFFFKKFFNFFSKRFSKKNFQKNFQKKYFFLIKKFFQNFQKKIQFFNFFFFINIAFSD